MPQLTIGNYWVRLSVIRKVCLGARMQGGRGWFTAWLYLGFIAVFLDIDHIKPS